MKTYYKVAIFLALLLSACAKDDMIVVEGANGIHPILDMEVVEILSEGKVYTIEGNPEIKKTCHGGYSDVVVVGTVVGIDDILWLKKGSIVGIKFKNNSYVINEPQVKDAFITFELSESHEK